MILCFFVFVVFLILKLTHCIGWSWWAVTIPLDVALAWVVIQIVFLGAFVGAIGAMFKALCTPNKI